jgi:hypothetical protein
MIALLAAPDPIGTPSDGPGAIANVIDLDLKKEAIGELCGHSLEVAWKFLIVAAVLALIIEAFGRSPVERRDYAGVGWRVFLVVILLTFYGPIFSTVIQTAQAIANEFKPMEANEQLGREAAEYFKQMKAKAQPPPSVEQQPPGMQAPPDAPDAGLLGGMVYEGAIHLFVTIGEALFWILGIISRIAILLLYAMGPLAIVASLPGPTSVGTRWFGHFVGVACWPIFSALIVRILLAVGISGFYSANAFGHVCVALAMALCALAVPFLSAALIGGPAATATQQGFKIASGGAASLMSAARTAHKQFAGPPPQARGQSSGGGRAPQNPPSGGAHP